MAGSSDKVRILLIRPWTEPLAPLRAALRDAGIEARITRVDIEPALNAALDRGLFDVVVFDPRTPNISKAILDERVRECRSPAKVVTLGSTTSVIDQIKCVLAERLN